MVNLTPESKTTLQNLRAAARRKTQAEADLQEAATSAVAAGVPALRVAEAAGIGRTTLYRWLEGKEAK